ncbi:hypothetical protein ACPXCE_04230 [Streptomyces sp. DT24]|uniref:hypothetical protein n=1 Tax=Streptomyces sp. DT24 TaxID=3416520 RepID=UPI003CEBB108
MHDLTCWEELRHGRSGGLVLAIDAPPHGRTATDFRELIPLLDTEHTVWHALDRSVGPRPPTGPAMDAWVASWTDEVRASGLRVRAVLGHGVGGALAGRIAENIAHRQRDRPEVLVFDAELMSAGAVLDRFDQVVSQVSRALDRAEFNHLGSALALAQEALVLAAARLSSRAEAAPGPAGPAYGGPAGPALAG